MSVVSNVWSDMRRWWQWRARQARWHLWGFSEYRSIGTVTARDDINGRTVSEDDGRFVYVSIPCSVAIDIGDRVEIAPYFQAVPAVRPYGWIVLRKVP